MTAEADTFLLQVITMRERLACLKTAAMGRFARDALIATMSKLDATMAELEMLARQSHRQSNGDHRNGDVPYASQPNAGSWIEPAGSERLADNRTSDEGSTRILERRWQTAD